MSARGPTNSLAHDAEGLDVLAGEYVLGMVDARTAASVARALPDDAELRQAVEAWEDQLTGLADVIPQEAPPPELWDRIAACLPAETGQPAAIARQQRAKPDESRGFAWLWRAWAVGATVATVALAGVAIVQTQRHDRLEASLVRPYIDRANPGQPAPVFAAPLPTAPAQEQQAITAPPSGAPQLSVSPSMAQSPPAQPPATVAAPALVPPAHGPVVLPATAPDSIGVTRPLSGGEGTTTVRPSSGDGTSTIRR